MVFTQIELEDSLDPRTIECPRFSCKNEVFIPCCIEIEPIIVGGLIVCYEISFGVECSVCQCYAKEVIGLFNDDFELLTDFPFVEKRVKELLSLNVKKEVLNKYKELEETIF